MGCTSYQSPMQSLFKHRWLRRLAIALVAFLLLWLLLWALVPVVAKSQLEKQASAKLGRQVRVGAVEFRPWSLELTLRDLSIARSQAEGAAPESVPSSSSSPQLQIDRSEEHTSELQSPCNLVCRLLLEKKKKHKQ